MSAGIMLICASHLYLTPGTEPPVVFAPSPTAAWTVAALRHPSGAPLSNIPAEFQIEIEVTADGLLFVSFGGNGYVEMGPPIVLQSGTAFDLGQIGWLNRRISMARHPELKFLTIERLPSTLDQMLNDPFFGKDLSVGCITINGR
jgi:hypothetical protein